MPKECATCIRGVSEKLGLTPEPGFDQTSKGFDAMFRQKGGGWVIVESIVAQQGIHALEDDQMQHSWIKRTVEKMQDREADDYYTASNAKIAAEISRVGPRNVQRLVVATHPGTVESTCFEGQADGSWVKIGSWSAHELGLPNLSGDWA